MLQMSAPYVILSRSRLRLTCACGAFPSCERPGLVQTRTILRIRYSRTAQGQEDLQQLLCSCTSPDASPCGCRRRSDPNRVYDGESSSSSLDHEWQASWLSDGQMELPLKCRGILGLQVAVTIAVRRGHAKLLGTRLLRKLMQPGWNFYFGFAKHSLSGCSQIRDGSSS